MLSNRTNLNLSFTRILFYSFIIAAIGKMIIINDWTTSITLWKGVYAPHAIDILTLSIITLVLFIPRYGTRTIIYFTFVYSSIELIFNITYLGTHLQSLLLNPNQYPFDNTYPYKMLVFTSAFIISILIIRPHIINPNNFIPYIILFSYIIIYLADIITNGIFESIQNPLCALFIFYFIEEKSHIH